jgi:hypothetical protein
VATIRDSFAAMTSASRSSSGSASYCGDAVGSDMAESDVLIDEAERNRLGKDLRKPALCKSSHIIKLKRPVARREIAFDPRCVRDAGGEEQRGQGK